MDDFKNDPKYLFKDGKVFSRASGEVIPADEPVMVFRARDIHAIDVIDYYRSIVNDENHKQAVDKRLDEFEAFAANHAERMKEPDTQLSFDV